jgi:hypothetical protein
MLGTHPNTCQKECHTECQNVCLEGTCSPTLEYMDIFILSFGLSFFCHWILSFFGPVICPCHLFVFVFVIFVIFVIFHWFPSCFDDFTMFLLSFNCYLWFSPIFHWFSSLFIGFLSLFNGFLSFSWIVQLFSWFFIGLPQNCQWICWCHARKSKILILDKSMNMIRQWQKNDRTIT